MEWGAWAGALAKVLVPMLVVSVFVAALWADRTRSRKMAQKWGIPEPADDQVDEVMRYRRLRLVCYPALFAAFAVPWQVWSPSPSFDRAADAVPLVAMFFAGAVIAELLALRQARSVPTTHIRLFDLVPRWAVALHAVLVAAVVVFGVIDLQAQPDVTPELLRVATNREPHVPIAVPFSGTLAVLLGVAFVLWSARSYSQSTDPAVDRMLPSRNARVALGLALGMQVLLLGLAWWRTELVATYPNAADAFPPTPVELATMHQAERMSNLAQPWTPVLFALGWFGWLYVANPPGRKPWERKARAT